MAAVAPFSLLKPSVSKEELRAHAAVLCSVGERQILDIFPCTALQKGLLALTAKTPGAYVTRRLYELPQDIDTQRFFQAWERVVAQNPILRTRIINLPSHGLVQVVLDEPAQWEHACSVSERRTRRREADDDMGLGTILSRFVYSKGTEESSKFLTWEMHHALCDGWSIDLLLRQVVDIYSGTDTPSLEPMSLLIQFLSSTDTAMSRSFWKSQFTDCTDSRFPKLRGVYNSRPNAQLSVMMSSLDWSQQNFTPATIITSAWSVVSAQALDQDEALFGMTITGRQMPIPGIERMAGPAIATIPIRVVLDWRASPGELSKKIQQYSGDVIPHAQSGLQAISRVSEHAELACKFHTLLVIQPRVIGNGPANDIMREVDEGEINSQWQDFDTYPLVIECQLDSDSVELRIAFDTSVLSESEVAYTIQHLEAVVRSLLQSPAEKSLRDIADASRPQGALEKIWKWNDQVPETVSTLIHDLITTKSQKQPTAPAICAWDGDLTYGQLEELSTRLAHIISSKDVQNTVIPLFFEKSKWMPVAAIAVMKSGGASVAVDTTQPEARLQAILGQTTPKLILASRQQAAVARSLASNTSDIFVVAESLTIPTVDLAFLPSVDPTHSLYVVFTSGSTGTPKGAKISHQNYASALAYQQQALGYKPSSRVLDFASYAFDASWYNLLNALTAGSCLCIPSADERQNRLAETFSRYKITLVDLIPSVARSLGSSVLSRLDTLILGGEAVLPSDAFLSEGETRIVNVYGPAECTPTSTFAEVKSSKITIGCGAGVCTWVVDIENSQSLTPLGSVGELWVEGPLVGQGYLNDPEKTAASFVHSPPWLTAGHGRYAGRQGLLYKTGDLVRQQPDGTLLFVGRRDQQVKINGQRVELGEIECQVQQAVQALAADGTNVQIIAEILKLDRLAQSVLAAFISLQSTEFSNPETHDLTVQNIARGLADSLENFLPRYMIPAIFVPVQRLPFTASGKIDRQKLHESGKSAWLQQSKNSISKETAAPATNMEKTLHQIWISILNMPAQQVSIDAGFARMGGDSITAMQIVSQCRLHGIDLKVNDVLEGSTIRNIALRSHSVSSERNEAGIDSDIYAVGETFELSPIQHMFFETYPDGLNHFNQSFILELRRNLSLEIIRKAIEALVDRHAMLRSRFEKSSSAGPWKQKIQTCNDPSTFGFCEHAVSGADEVVMRSQWRQEHLDIENGPVFACDVFQFPDSRKVITLSAHHLVVDLVSWRIIWANIEEYVQHGQYQMQPTASFYSWSKRQIKTSSHLSPLSVLPYAVPDPQFDFWGLEPSHNTFSGTVNSSNSFSADVTSRLNSSCEHHIQCEPVDVVLGTIAWSFSRTFPERSVPTIWTEGHGRELTGDLQLDLSQTVGWFTTLCPIAAVLRPEDSLAHAVRLVKDMRRSVPGKGRPYYACRYYSRAGRHAFDRPDDNEVTFNMTGSFQQLESEDGLFKNFEEEELALVEITPSAQRLTMIEINASVEESELTVSFAWHRDCKYQERMHQWSHLFSESLESIVGILLREPPTLTLTDLPLLPISYSGLDNLMTNQLCAIDIDSARVKEVYPCLPLQEGIIISQETGLASYATYTIFRVEPNDQGAPEVSTIRLENAWRSVIQRHSILSTIFVDHPEGDGFVQVVLRDPDILITQIATDSIAPSSRLEKLPRPTFRPSQPQHAFTIYKSASGDVACRLDISHALIDAVSMDILRREITAAYDDPVLLPEPGKFSAMVQHVTDAPRARSISSWVELLEGIQPCEFQVFADSVDPATTEKHGEVHTNQRLLSDVSDLCKNLEISRSAFLHTAWALVLSHFTGIQDVCFGYLFSGRGSSVAGIETIVGPIASLLISRVDLQSSYCEVLQSTSKNLVQHLGIQYTSLAEIQHELGASHRRLFNTSISIRDGGDFSPTAKKTTGISLVSCDGEDPHEHDIGVSVRLDREYLDIVIEYKEPQVTLEVAQEACDMFVRAINFLLHFSSSQQYQGPESPSLSESFFKEVVDQDRTSAHSFWTAQFENTNGAHFPSPESGLQSMNSERKASSEIKELELHTTVYSLEALVRASWSILAARSLGTDEAIFGIADSNRPMSLPMRVSLDWADSVDDLFEQIETQCRQIAAFQPVSSQFIRRTSEGAATASDFKTLLYECKPDDPTSLPIADLLTEIPLSIKVPVVVAWQGQGARAKIAIQSAADAAESIQVARITEQFEHVFDQLQSPSLRRKQLGEISLLSRNDLDEIWAWNASVPEATKDCVHHLIAATVATQPEAFAVAAWDGNLTYRELDALSTTLAHRLVKSGVTGGSVVPLCFEKSMWMPVAALAVMKAGAASVSMDPSTQPEERMRAIASKVQAQVALCSHSYDSTARRLGVKSTIVVASGCLSESVCPVSRSAQISRAESNPALPKVLPSAPLYIIFTSGTTGEPKGIVIPHSAFSSAITYQRTVIGFKPTSRVLDFSSYAFDVVWSNLLNTLVVGACLCIPSAIERDDVVNCLSHYEITYADFTPPFARSIEPKTAFAMLETMTLGGEAMLPSDRSLVPSTTQVNNAYGPAECTPTSTINIASETEGISIGKGIGVCTWLTEPDNPNALAAIGAVGELWIEGPLVGAGYINEPEKTAAAFIEDPIWLIAGNGEAYPGRHGRLYRTGDLVRYADDGSLVFVGRRDTQVKIRGQRVELGEVEHRVRQAILSSEACEAAEVVADVIQPRESDSKILAAFIELSPGNHSLDPEKYSETVQRVTKTATETLTKVLPPYMIPTVFFPIQRMPTLPTGKIDRRYLQNHGSQFSTKEIAALDRSRNNWQEPLSEVEALVRDLCAEVLHIESESISMNDSFFRMGGDSIGAMKLAGKANQKGTTLTVRDVFRSPVLQDLSALIESASRSMAPVKA